MIKRILVWIGVIAVLIAIGAFAFTRYIQGEAEFRHETLAPAGAPRALILYDPSRDAGFSDEISLAVAKGFAKAGLAVDRETITAKTPGSPQGYAVVAVVSNTFFAAPDTPTIHYLARADLKHIAAIGLICGAGSTDEAQRKLDQALRRTGADVRETRHYWISRPNDEKRRGAPNRVVAAEMAQEFGREIGLTLKVRQAPR